MARQVVRAIREWWVWLPKNKGPVASYAVAATAAAEKAAAGASANGPASTPRHAGVVTKEVYSAMATLLQEVSARAGAQVMGVREQHSALVRLSGCVEFCWKPLNRAWML